MADNSYKIELGVKLNTKDLQDQISDAGKTVDPIKIQIDAETKELTKTIKEALNSLSKGTEGALKIDTSKIETSLESLSEVIKDIRTSLGTLDSGDMKSLVSSINQMTKALGKAENESDSLVKSLTALSKKDLSINFGFNMGKSASQVASEQGDIKRNAISQLKQQAKALETYLDQYYKVAQQGEGVVKLTQGTNLFNVFWEMSPNIGDTKASLKQQVDTYKQYIHLMQEAAKIKGVDLSGVTSGFSKTTDDIVKETSSAANGVEQLTQAFKGLFGSGIDAEGLSASLEPITKDLTEIREAVVNLSKGVSLEGLTQSFDRLSTSIENLLANAERLKGIFNGNLGGSSIGSTVGATSTADTAPIKSAQQIGEKIGETVTKAAQQTINLDDVIDKQVSALMNEYAIAGDKGSKAFKEIRQSLVDFRNGTVDINKVTSAISNNMKVVNEAKDDYKDLAEHIKMFNASGAKVHIPDSIKQEYGDDYKSMRSQLGRAFTSGKGMDFETFIEETNSILGQTIDLSHGAEAAFGDLVNKVNSTKGGKFLTGDDLFRSGILDMGDVVADVSTSLEKIENANVLRQINGFDSAKKELKSLNFNTKSLDSMIDDFNNLGVQVKDISHILNKDGSITFNVSGVDKLGNAVKAIKTLDSSGGFKSFSSSISQSLKESDKFIKQQKQSVTDLTNQINKLNRESIDPNASKPIKDETHLNSLTNKYNEVISAIKKMGDASSNTFDEERNAVKTLISEYQSLTREYKNAETVATSLRSKDVNTVKATYASKLDVLISKMKDTGVYTSGFENGAENLRSVLSGSIDASGLVSFLNGLDKLEAGYKRAAQSAKSFSQAQTYGKRASSLESEVRNLQRISPEINQFEAEINGVKVSVQSLLKDLSQVKTKSDFNSVNEDLKAFKKAAEAVGIAVKETITKVNSVDKIKDKLADTGFNGFKQEVARAHIEAEKLEISTDSLEDALRRLDTAMAGIYSADQSGDIKRLVTANEEYESALKRVYSQLKLNQQAEKQAYDAEILSQKKASLSSDMEIWLKENTRATKDFGEEIRRLQASLDKLDANGVKLVGQQFNNLKKQAQVMGKTGLTVFDKLKVKAKEYAAYLSAAELFMYAEQAFREMFNAVKEIDTAMTGLYRVTDLTAAEYDTLFDNMISSAKEYGATLNDIINATTDWVRAGFEANTALGLAEVTTMYQHISDLDYDTAAENLITAYNGFKDELNGAFSGDEVAAVNYIADILNELDNNYAATSAGIGEALTRSASALDLAGNSIQETAG